MTTLRKKIGQMLIMGFSGTEVNKASPIYHELTTDGLGGVILFDYDLANNIQGKNLVSRQQITELNQQLMACSALNSDIPLFIAIDYEGGAIDRLKHIDGCMTTLSPLQLSALSDNELAFESHKMALTLRSLGFNLNFAPVLDLDLNHQQGIIGKLGRSFSSNPSDVARVAQAFVNAFRDEQITCCYKHFPGHGSAIGDTHHGFVDVSDTFLASELEPYHTLISSTDTMIMTAHVINRQLDSSGLPATLSFDILTKLLRDKMGYNGVIISDDLQMNAISNHFSIEDALCLTINAGADMVIFGNQLGMISASAVIDIIEQLVLTQKIALSRIEQAWQRIIHLKQLQKVSILA